MGATYRMVHDSSGDNLMRGALGVNSVRGTDGTDADEGRDSPAQS